MTIETAHPLCCLGSFDENRPFSLMRSAFLAYGTLPYILSNADHICDYLHWVSEL